MSLPPPTVPITTKAGMDFYIESAKFTRQFSQRLREIRRIPGLADGLTNVIKRNAYLNGKFSKVDDAIVTNTKRSDLVKKNLEKLLEKTPGKDTAQKAGRASGQLAQVAVLAGLVVFVAAKTITDMKIQDLQISNDDVTRSEIQKAFDRYQRNVIDIRGLSKQIQDLEKLTKQRLKNEDKLYAEAGSAVKNATKAREMANEALYETRQGRKNLENQISTAKKNANDALYETRQGRQILEGKITSIQTKVSQVLANLNQGVNQQLTNSITAIQKTLISANAQVTKLNSELISQRSLISSLQANNNVLNAKINSIKPPQTIDVNAIVTSVKQAATAEINNLRRENYSLSAQLQGVQLTVGVLTGSIPTIANSAATANYKAEAAMQEAKIKGTPNLAPLQKQLDDKFNQLVEQNKKELGSIDLKQGELSKQFDQQFKNFQDLSTKSANERFEKFQQQNKQDLNKISNSVTESGQKIKELDTKIKEQTKMNEEGNKKLGSIDAKLDSLIPSIAGIPLVVGKAANDIINQMPTPNDIEAATGKAMCTNFKTGCGKKALDDLGNTINNNTNGNADNLLQKLGLAGQGIDLAVLGVINDKLGDKVPGGLSGFLTKNFKWLNFDRITNMITLWVTIHNASMLSAQLGDTLLTVIENGLTIFNIKDADNQPIDLNEYLGKQVEQILKDVLGAENYAQAVLQWKRASTIYRSAANVANSFTGLGNSIINGLEVVGGQNAKIGNALRTWGAVGERAYEVFNPNPSFKVGGILDKINNLDDAANFVLQVSQVPIDITQSWTQMTEANTEFLKTLKEETRKGIQIADAEKQKQKEEDARNASSGIDTDSTDKLEAED